MRRTVALALLLPLAAIAASGAAAPTSPPGDPDRANTSLAAVSPDIPDPLPPADPAPRSETSPTDGTYAPSAAGAEAEGEAEGEGETEAPDATEPRTDATEGSNGDTPDVVDDAERAPVESGFLVAAAPEEGGVAGTGPRWRYTIEVEPGLDVDLETFAVEVRAALTDERSWARTRTLEQVDDPARARIRVVLASPDTVDELCGRAGLRTAGIYSCWNGRFAALNSWRWEAGADAFDDITTYRNYLVNHEFGHGLGYGHVGCPAAGAPAPVMMQQSKGVDACVPNGWPYP